MANSLLGETSPRGDGWYWRIQIRWADDNDRTIHITAPVVARDDSGCGPLILSATLWLELGQPETRIREGNGFGYRIPHRVLTEDARAENKYSYRLVGVDMEWKPFFPIFFEEHQAVAGADLSLLSTLGWKEQAKLADDGIGFVQKGYKRCAVWSREAGTSVVKKMWDESA